MEYSIREVAIRTGLPASTLRYYEREGLLCDVQRNGVGRRIYGEEAMDWLSIITCLKNTGMPIQEIRRFVALCGQGDQTLSDRYRIILAHRAATEARIEALQKELEHIDRKAAYYRAACAAGSERNLSCEAPAAVAHEKGGTAAHGG